MTDAFLSAREAAAELNVSLATLYAYVSRGLIRSEPQPGSRSRLYSAADVRLLREGRDRIGREAATVDAALDWGAPVLESTLTLIADGRLLYRGRDAARLAQGGRLEPVAALLWGAEDADPFAADAPTESAAEAAIRAAAGGLAPIDRALALLPAAEAADLRVFDQTPAGQAAASARVLRRVVSAWLDGAPRAAPIHERLATAWGASREGARLIGAGLILAADHELNASTFAARVAASTGASLYAAVAAGLAAFKGPRHGGQTERAAALLDELLAADDPRDALAARLRRGDEAHGFGHRLYPQGDPRARALLGALERSPPDEDGERLAAALRAGEDLTGAAPTIDMALAAVARRLRLPSGAAFGIFAVGRCVGWLAHALEQKRSGALIRPRARYVGPRG